MKLSIEETLLLIQLVNKQKIYMMQVKNEKSAKELSGIFKKLLDHLKAI